MDSINLDSDLQQGLSALSPKDKQELQQFALNEAQKASIQGVIHELTSTCFQKCITSRISSSTLDRNEEPCLRNCVDRFMDAQNSVLTMLQRMQGSHQ